jgi:enamine deaminase RidA (YjgF/YER057c/UK114 family)
VHADKSFKDQVIQVLDNIDACLRQLNLPRESLVQVRVYVVGMSHWKDFDVIYSKWIGDHRPSRAVVGVNELHFGALLELEAVAAISRG